MEIKYFIDSLQNSGKKIEMILSGVSKEQAQWKPEPTRALFNLTRSTKKLLIKEL